MPADVLKLPSRSSPSDSLLRSPGVSIDFASPSRGGEVSASEHKITTEIGEAVGSIDETYDHRSVQTEPMLTTTVAVQTSGSESLPLDYVLVRPPRPRSKRTLFHDSKADLSAVCAPCPKLCLPSHDSFLPVRTEELEYVLMATQQDPVSSSRMCD
jgi:hypothetical protein